MGRYTYEKDWNEKMKIIHIVDSLPNYVGGVSDYAYKLSYELKEKHNVESYFVTVKDFHDFDRSFFHNIDNIHKERNLYKTVKDIVENHFSKGEKINIVLEYVGYAYQKRGCPIWLLLELKKIKKRHSIHLITMFHELYAVSNNPKTSTFWLSWLQKYITREIFHLSDSVKTNTVKYFNELKQWDKTKQIDILPVFSNVGEKSSTCKFSDRNDSVIIFGSKASREKVYRYESFGQVLLDRFSINEAIDIGTGETNVPVMVSQVKKLGRLDVNEIEEIMSQSKFGLIEYGDMPLEKSGIFAAYMAHGVIPIVLNCYNKESLYVENKHYISTHATISDNNLSKMSSFLIDEYKKYASIENHTNSYMKDLIL